MRFLVSSEFKSIRSNPGGFKPIEKPKKRLLTKQNEHPEYDDHPPKETYAQRLESYLRLIGKERAPREE